MDIRRRRATAVFFAVVVFLMGATVTGLAAGSITVAEHRDRSSDLALRGRELIDRVQNSAGQGLERTRATGALFEASIEVTDAEFARYARRMGPGEAITVIGYVPLDGSSAPLEHSYRDGVTGVAVVRSLDLSARVAEFQWSKQPRMEGTFSDIDPDSLLFIGPVFATEGGNILGVTFTVVDLTYVYRLRSFQGLEPEFREASGAVSVPEPGPDAWTGQDRVAGRNWVFTLTDPGPEHSHRESWLVAGFGTLGTLLAVVGVHLQTRRRDTEVALGELRRSTEDKDRFLASVSHELRTPLTSVVGAAAVLESAWREIDAEQVQQLLEDIHHEGRELSDLVEDLLTVGRDESGVLSYRPEIIDLDAEVAGVVSRLRAATDVEISVRPGLGSALADALRTRQVVRNLLVNAVRHADRLVRVEPVADSTAAAIAVVNDGEGIPDHEAPRLFQAYQAGLREGQPGSIGLGLYVSRRLAQGMGGNLAYAPRDGMVVFELRLPSASQARAVPTGDSEAYGSGPGLDHSA